MRFEVFQEDDGAWRWRLRGSDDRIVAVAGQAEYSEAEAKQAAAEFKQRVELASLPEWEADDGEQ